MATDNDEDLSVSGQLKKIIEHLGFLEKKLDSLLEQSGQRRMGQGRFGNQGFGRHGRSYHGGHAGSSDRPGHSGRPGGFHSKFSGHSHGRPSHGPRRGFHKRHGSDHSNPGNQL